MSLEKLKFPIGKNVPNKHPSNDQVQKWILEIKEFPSLLIELTNDLSPEQLNWVYRPGGWNIAQVVHHCADSHMNSLMRFKLTLTEKTPTIRPYFEDRWAELTDYSDDNINDSIAIITGLHAKWTRLLTSLSTEQLLLEFVHPEHGVKTNLSENIGIYAWHGNHHLAHIQNALKYQGNFNSQ